MHRGIRAPHVGMPGPGTLTPAATAARGAAVGAPCALAAAPPTRASRRHPHRVRAAAAAAGGDSSGPVGGAETSSAAPKPGSGAGPGQYERLRAAVRPQSPGTSALHTEGHIMFSIPPATRNTPMEQVLACPTMREFLGPARPNPLLANLEGVWEGKYVSDEDRVAMNVMDFASASSSGAYMLCQQPSHTYSGAGAAAATDTSSSSSSSGPGAAAGGGAAGTASATTGQQQGSASSVDVTSSRHLALCSGVYGSMLSSVDGLHSSDFSLDALLHPGGAGAQHQQQAQQLPGHQHDVCVALPPYAMRAGPRDTVYLDPSTVTAAIVTTGGICPGMNDVIEAMVKRLGDYGVPAENVMGIRYGMRGFFEKSAKPMVLTRDKIEGIHLQGGTILGTSVEQRPQKQRRRHTPQHYQRSPGGSGASSEADAPGAGSSGSGVATTDDEDAGSPAASSSSSSSSRVSAAASASPGSSVSGYSRSGSPIFDSYEDKLEAILDKLAFWRVNMLLVIGGQGGNQLASQLAEGCHRREIPCCIVGVPKSIDNDVLLVDRTFGFDTVVQEVVTRPLLAAKTEAASARKGVGLVKVFGRRAGFIALQSSLASGVVDICLIPEEPFELEGPNGLLAYLAQVLEDKGHAVICVSEGAGQDLLYPGNEAIPVDEAGNPVLRDIGGFLKAAIKRAIPDADVKYIDPSNMVQAVPCNAADHLLCRVLGFHAVDVAFAGFTGVIVAPVNGHFCMLPSAVVTQTARRVDPRGKSWNRLRASIGQPRFINGAATDMAQPPPPSAAAKPAAGAGAGAGASAAVPMAK